MTRLAAIKIPLVDGVRLLLAPTDETTPESGLGPQNFLPVGWDGKLGNETSPILYDSTASANGMHSLAVVEIAAFHWELQVDPAQSCNELDLRSSLSGSLAHKQWHARRTSGRLHGDFRFTIYLGAAWFQLFRQGEPVGRRVHFEVITEKIAYAQEYRAMVEAIGNRCSQLLLDWGACPLLSTSPPIRKSRGRLSLRNSFFFGTSWGQTVWTSTLKRWRAGLIPRCIANVFGSPLPSLLLLLSPATRSALAGTGRMPTPGMA